MGTSYSFLKAEQKTWTDHTLEYDHAARSINLPLINRFVIGKPVRLGYVDCSWGGLDYQHWLVSDGNHHLEFGSAGLDIYNARVMITQQKQSFHILPYGDRNGRCDSTTNEIGDWNEQLFPLPSKL